jgi:hypothetical protein
MLVELLVRMHAAETVSAKVKVTKELGSILGE